MSLSACNLPCAHPNKSPWSAFTMTFIAPLAQEREMLTHAKQK